MRFTMGRSVRRPVRDRRRLLMRIALIAFTLVAILGAATYLAFRQDIRAARARALAGSSLLETRCGRIEYATAGAGPAVLSIHGTGGGWDQGLKMAEGLSERGFRVIAPSRYGYLRTPLPDHPSPASEADFLACFLDALGLQQVHVIAASAGAAPALQLALRHADRVSSLVLLVPAIGGILPTEPEAMVSPFIMNVVLGSDLPYWAAMKAKPSLTLRIVAVPESLVPTLSPDDRRHLDEMIATILPVSARRRGILYDAHTQSTAAPFPLVQITVPTLLASAEDDLYRTLPNARAAAAAIPRAQLLEFERGGHLLLGCDDQLWPVVAAFMREHAAIDRGGRVP